MKAVQIIFILLISLKVTAQRKQLLYIVEADRSSYIDKDLKRHVYPKLHLSTTKDDSVFFYDKLVYYKKILPSEGLSVFYEIYNNDVLVVTYRGKDQLGASEPIWVKRSNICIVNLKSPDSVYYVDLLQKRLLTDESIFNAAKNYRDIFYLILDIDFNEQIIVLKDIDDKIEKLKLIPLEK